MAKITKLTEAQEKRLVEFREEWLAHGLSCEPANFAPAEEAITEFYKKLGKAPPIFLHFSSPMMCEMAVSAMLTGEIGNDMEAATPGTLANQLWNQFSRQSAEIETRSVSDDGAYNKRCREFSKQLGELVNNHTKERLKAKRAAKFKEQLQKLAFFNNAFWGQHEAYWVAFYLFAAEIGAKYTPSDAEALENWAVLARSCGWWAPWSNVCLISDRPRFVSFDNERRLHCEHQAAVKFADGWGVHAIHGVRVPEFVVKRPHEITVAIIDKEQNAEVRRIMMDRYKLGEEPHGPAAFLRDGNAKRLDHDDAFGTLWVREVPGDEPITVLECVNRSPEPDGTFKHYWMRVHPELRPLPPGEWPEEKKREWIERQKPQKLSARAAAASLHGKRADEYNPMVET